MEGGWWNSLIEDVNWEVLVSVLAISYFRAENSAASRERHGCEIWGLGTFMLKCLILRYKFLSLGLSLSPMADVEKTSHVGKSLEKVKEK